MRFTLPILLLCALILAACGGDDPTGPGPADSRSYRMGFSGIPPREEFDLAVAAIMMWAPRADAAILSFEPPWEALLAGARPESLVAASQQPLADFYRAQGHEVWVYLDPGNGLNRGGESTELVDAGRSITEPEVQALYRRYAVVLDSMIRPDHVGLALETNLIRYASPPSLYAAIRQVVNDTATALRNRGSAARLGVSVQVDFARGRLGTDTPSTIDQDFVDFPFIEVLGLSSYPYLAGFDEAGDIPLDYYTSVVAGHDVPVAVTEGGWSSATLDDIVSSEDEQRRYIEHHARLLDEVAAIAVFQLTFTDLDVASITPPPPPILGLFAALGLVDVDLQPKAALAAWDAVFARPPE